ncbi:hypothetical protein FIV37_20245 [Pseudomonas gessardii]|nr:hypothetical protein [Pseudomonas gessardii]
MGKNKKAPPARLMRNLAGEAVQRCIALCAGLCGSGLARDAGTSCCQLNRGDAIAGKPDPTQTCSTGWGQATNCSA